MQKAIKWSVHRSEANPGRVNRSTQTYSEEGTISYDYKHSPFKDFLALMTNYKYGTSFFYSHSVRERIRKERSRPMRR